MAEYKTTGYLNSAWNYEQEIEKLNEESQNGWQLVKGGAFANRFEKNPNVCYRYQLDFGKIENMGRYIEMFREQGWEYINSTFNGWHYFRKLYDPALPESAYEIFTDRESLQEMRMRWTKIAMGIGIALGLFFLISLVRCILHPHLAALAYTLTLGIESALLLGGAAIMRNPDANHNRKGESLYLGAILGVIVVGAIAGIVLSDLRPDFHTEQQWASSDNLEWTTEKQKQEVKDWLTFEVHYPDNYFLDLSIEADEPLTFAIEDTEGNSVYSITESHFDGKNIRLPLKQGEYHYRLKEYGKGAVHIKSSLE